MILTGHEIELLRHAHKLTIEPFDIRNMGPNSYNVCLHNELLVYMKNTRKRRFDPITNECHYVLDMKSDNAVHKCTIHEDGYLLTPGTLYLGRTVEYTETHAPYVPMLEGRSSIARLGMSIHATAGFGDIGYKGHWTLEISVTEPLIVYPWVPVGQLFYLKAEGQINKIYQGKYQNATETLASRLFVEQDNWTSRATQESHQSDDVHNPTQ